MRRLLAIALASAAAAHAAASVCDVTSFGAAGTGKTLDTAAIQKAVDSCAAAGGGVVYFPRGDYLSGTFVLKSNITLHLAPGSTLWGSRNIRDYSPRHLIYASGAANIAIEGGGTINGQSDAFFDQNRRPMARPSPLIELRDCQDIRIQDVRILKAPGWTIHPKNCARVKIRGISLINDMLGLNTDGIDPDSSRDVIISDSYIESGDDCIVVKTTKEGGRVLPSENVTVTNCVLRSSASALKLGTESYADFRHLVFSNCVIRDSRTGIALLNKDGATMEGVSFSNITMETAPKFGKGVEWPIVIDLEKRAPDSKIGRIRDIVFSNIQIYTKGRVMATGMPQSPLERIAFRNLAMRIGGWERIEDEHKLQGGTVVPMADALDYGAVPAAMILAHARGVELRDVRVLWDGPAPAPERHAIWGERLEGLVVNGFAGRQSAGRGKLAAIQLKDSRDITVTGSRAAPETGTFLRLDGGEAGEVFFEGNDMRRAQRAREP
jgi:hypothetical protein